jgi:hypothetical protein
MTLLPATKTPNEPFRKPIALFTLPTAGSTKELSWHR